MAQQSLQISPLPWSAVPWGLFPGFPYLTSDFNLHLLVCFSVSGWSNMYCVPDIVVSTLNRLSPLILVTHRAINSSSGERWDPVMYMHSLGSHIQAVEELVFELAFFLPCKQLPPECHACLPGLLPRPLRRVTCSLGFKNRPLAACVCWGDCLLVFRLLFFPSCHSALLRPTSL